MQSSPQIYVACLAAYNNGKLHGVWIEFYEGIEADDVQAEIDAMLKSSPEPDAEEWDIHDSESFADFKSHDLEKLCQVAELIHQHGEEAVKGFISHVGEDYLFDRTCSFEDTYLGCFESEASFCEDHFSHLSEASEQIQVFSWGATLDQFIDWERIAHDAFINSYYSHQPSHNEVHVYLR
jgi:antirestriction protein